MLNYSSSNNIIYIVELSCSKLLIYELHPCLKIERCWICLQQARDLGNGCAESPIRIATIGRNILRLNCRSDIDLLHHNVGTTWSLGAIKYNRFLTWRSSLKIIVCHITHIYCSSLYHVKSNKSTLWAVRITRSELGKT